MAEQKKIRIRLESYDHELIDQSAKKIVEIVSRTSSKVSGPIPLPTEKKIITVLRSTQVNKDSREQFESRTHKRLIDVLRPSNKILIISSVSPAAIFINSSSFK